MNPYQEVDDLNEIFKILGDKTRLTIFSLLNVKELCVCEITEILNVSQPAISQHLRKLKLLNLVRERKEGKWVYYSLRIPNKDKKMLNAIIENLPDMSELIPENSGKSCKL